MSLDLSYKNILLVNLSSSLRVQVNKLLSEFSAKKDRVSLAGSFEEAKILILEKNFDLVIADLNVEDEKSASFLNLLSVELYRPDRIHIFLCEAKNHKQLEDAYTGKLESFLARPFVYKEMESKLKLLLLQLLKPSQKEQVLFRVANLYSEKKYQEIRDYMKSYGVIGEEEADLLYFYGKNLEVHGFRKEALLAFDRALKAKPLHVRCLYAQYDLALRDKNYALAYSSLLKLRAIHALSSVNLGELFILNVFNSDLSNLEEQLEDYYRLEFRPENLTKIVSTALSTSAKKLISASKLDEAKKLYLKIVSMNNYAWHIIESAARQFMKFSHWEQAEELLMKARDEDKSSSEYIELDFVIGARIVGDHYVIEKYRELHKEKKDLSPVIFEEVIRAQANRKNQMGFEQALMEASRLYPEQRKRWGDLEMNYQEQLSKS